MVISLGTVPERATRPAAAGSRNSKMEHPIAASPFAESPRGDSVHEWTTSQRRGGGLESLQSMSSRSWSSHRCIAPTSPNWSTLYYATLFASTGVSFFEHTSQRRPPLSFEVHGGPSPLSSSVSLSLSSFPTRCEIDCAQCSLLNKHQNHRLASRRLQRGSIYRLPRRNQTRRST